MFGKSTFSTTTPAQTRKKGEILARKILKTRPDKKALVLGLIGELGGGKTTFLQGFAKGLGIKEKINSPTFVILKRFQVLSLRDISRRETRSTFQNFYHIDCYRIKKAKELFDLGFKEIISNPRNIVAIEWVDLIAGALTKKMFMIKFKFSGQNVRKITIQAPLKSAIAAKKEDDGSDI